MFLYFKIISFYFQKFLTYPLEIIAALINRIVQIGFLLLFWSLVLEYSSIEQSIFDLAAYFLIADGIGTIVMGIKSDYGRTLRHAIRDGEINNYLIKPINILSYLHAYTMGKYGMKIIIALISITIGIIIKPPTSLTAIFLFLLYLPLAFLIALGFNILEGALTFIFTEINGMKNAFNHISRILSGSLIPIYLFPENIKNIVEYLPFPFMVFAPTNALSTNSITPHTYQLLLTAFIWAVVLNILALYLWNKYRKKYEAIGI